MYPGHPGASSMKLSNVNGERKLLPCSWGWSEHKLNHCFVMLVFCFVFLLNIFSSTNISSSSYLFTTSPFGEIHQANLKCIFSRNLHNSFLIFTYLLMLREQSFIFLSGWFRQQVVLYLTALCIVYVCLTGAMCKLHSRESNPLCH